MSDTSLTRPDRVKQLETLNAFVAPSVAKLVLQDTDRQPGGTWRRFHAATVFADISGFTPLAEELAAVGVRGAEVLTGILNDVFEALISAAEAQGGPTEVVKFGGDALSLIWPCQPDEADMREALLRAVQAAFAMQNSMARFSTVSVSQGEFNLRMKIGLSVGEVLEVHAGGVFGRWEYVLAGGPMASMSRAENHAQADEVVADEAAWQLLKGQVLEPDQPEWASFSELVENGSCVIGQAVGQGFYKITHLLESVPHTALQTPDWSILSKAEATKVSTTLRDYIPGAIKSILESGRRGEMMAELKPMTVCFVGFEGIDYDADANAGPHLSDFMGDAQKMIYHYEGSVNKLAVGDKGSVLLVLFGAPPFFHEDDELRGVACALALQQVAARFDLRLRVGLAAGPIFAGPLGPLQRREYAVIGDTVNLAARLMQKAEFGQVWADHTVQRKAQKVFDYADLGQVAIKGKTEPRQVYQVLGEKEQDQEDMVMTYLLSTQELTGREVELTDIDALADRVWPGQGQVLLLSGEAGVGKSRLAGEIVRRWMVRGGSPHGGDCVSYGRQTPYLPWRGVISSLAGLSPRLSVRERLNRLEQLLRQLTEPPPGMSLESENYWPDRLPLLAEMLGLETEETDLTRTLSEELRTSNLFAVIRALLIQEARSRPALVMLEDTHWSDELSLALMAHLARSIAGVPIFLVAVHRPLSEPVPANYKEIVTLPYTTKMPLIELGTEASLKLVRSKLGVRDLPPDLADLISSKGQGNPFFIEELVNSLFSMGVLKIEDDECLVLGDLGTLELPDTVQRVVLARIDRLPEEEKVTLKVAAAIGRTFQRDLLKDVHPWFTAESGETGLDRQLARLQAEDFTRPEGSTENELDFLFKHVITREVAYETMLYSQRQELHATIGQALESRARENDNEIIDLLAYHYALSDNREKAAMYLTRAGDKALLGNANDAAATYFSQALDVIRELGREDDQFNILARREQAYNRLGRRMAQAEDLRLMKELALNQSKESIRILQMLETENQRLLLLTNLGQYTQAIAVAEDILELARSTQLRTWEARILANLGITYWRQGEYVKAEQAMQQSLTLTGRLSDDQLKATCFNYLGLIHTRLSQYPQAREDYQQAMAIYRETNDKAGEAACANNFGLLEASLGRYEQARQQYEHALTICQSLGDRQIEGISLNILGQVHTCLGRYELAADHLHRSLEIRQAIGDRRGEAFCLHDIGSLYLARSQPAEAAHRFHTAAGFRQELGESGNYIASLAAKGEAALQAGDLETASVCLETAVNHLKSGGGSGEYPPQGIWWAYARLCLAGNNLAQAGPAYHQATDLVQAKAAQIAHVDFRRSYLQNVQLNADILAAEDDFSNND